MSNVLIDIDQIIYKTFHDLKDSQIDFPFFVMRVPNNAQNPTKGLLSSAHSVKK